MGAWSHWENVLKQGEGKQNFLGLIRAFFMQFSTKKAFVYFFIGGLLIST